MHHAMITEPLISTVHITHHDGYMLERKIVAAGIIRYGPATSCEVINKLDVLITQLQAHDPGSNAK